MFMYFFRSLRTWCVTRVLTRPYLRGGCVLLQQCTVRYGHWYVMYSTYHFRLTCLVVPFMLTISFRRLQTYFDTSSSAVADSTRPHPPLEHLSGIIVSSLERLLQPAVESVLINHPLLVSSLVAVVQCRADLQAPR